MDLNKYTQKSQEAILGAQQLAQELNHQTIEPAHLLLSLLRQQDGVVPAIVTKVAGSEIGLREELTQEMDNHPKVYGGTGEVGLARPTADVLAAAERYAKGMQDDYVSTEHILLGLTEGPEGKRSQYGLTKDAILKALRDVHGRRSASPPEARRASVLGKIRARSDRSGSPGQNGSGDRARRGNPPRRADSPGAPRTTRH